MTLFSLILMINLSWKRNLLTFLLKCQPLFLRTWILYYTILLKNIRVLQHTCVTGWWLSLRKFLCCFESVVYKLLILFVMTSWWRNSFYFSILGLDLLFVKYWSTLLTIWIYNILCLSLLLSLILSMFSLSLKFSFLPLLIFSPNFSNYLIYRLCLSIWRKTLNFLICCLSNHGVIFSNILNKSTCLVEVFLRLSMILEHF